MNILQSLPATKSKSQKRKGRGYGSGVGGHTVGRGQKGQKARNSVPLWFEGGQLPLIKRLPMLRGKGRLVSLFLTEIVKTGQLDKLNLKEITLETLKSSKAISRTAKKAKIITAGEVKKSVTVRGVQVSKSARVLIEKAGGKIEN